MADASPNASHARCLHVGAQPNEGHQEDQDDKSPERQRNGDPTSPARTELLLGEPDAGLHLGARFLDVVHDLAHYRHAPKWLNSPPDIRSTSSIANSANRYRIEKPN